MQNQALENLRELWLGFQTLEVRKVVCRPEDLMHYWTPTELFESDGLLLHARTETTDKPLNERSKPVYRQFFGFAKGGHFFHSDDNAEVDLDIDHTCTFGTWLNHHSYDAPPVGAYICGHVARGPRGPKFTKWFLATPEWGRLRGRAGTASSSWCQLWHSDLQRGPVQGGPLHVVDRR